MLKLGTVYNLLGNTELAIQTWTALPQRYPASSTEIKYAEEFLQGVR